MSAGVSWGPLDICAKCGHRDEMTNMNCESATRRLAALRRDHPDEPWHLGACSFHEEVTDANG